MTSQLKNIFIGALLVSFACADNELDVLPVDQNFPLQIILDSDEGGDLPDAEDYDVEVTFADYIGKLPNTPITLTYAITDLEDSMEGNISIDKIVYEYEDDNCVFERELNFISSADGLTGTIQVAPDADLGSVPESFEIVFTLPGEDDTEGSFKFELKTVQTSANVILGAVTSFEYEVLDNEVAGEWELELETEEDFERFKQVFGNLNSDIDELSFEDITGKVAFEFEYSEMNMEIELAEEEEITTCEDGETETETENKIIEFESDYEAEDEALTLEGSHEIIGDDGEAEDELDFIIEASYEIDDEGNLTISFTRVVDEDNFKSGKEFFNASGNAITFKLAKD